MRSEATSRSFGRWAALGLALFFSLQVFMSSRLEKWVHPEPFESSQSGDLDQKVVSSLRAAALLTGYRVLIGHVFWIEVIQYYGNGANAADHFSKLYDYCRLASDLNPQFVPVYSYGAAALAYQLNRVDEAEKLLKKGILANPHDNSLKFLFAAMTYHNSSNYAQEVPYLEAQIMQGNAPTMLINILANTYKKVGRTNDAIRLWRQILATTDSDTQKYEAAQKLKELYAISKTTSAPTKAKH